MTITEAPVALVQPPVVLFDGTCHLCDGTVQWLLAHDRRRVLRFAALQSDAAQQLLSARASGPLPDSLVLIDDQGVHVRSEAVLQIAAHLGSPWSWWRVTRIVPGSLRDRLYAWVAANRYRWFGRRDVCMRPAPDVRERFLDAGDPAGVATPPLGPLPSDEAASVSFARAWARRLLPTVLVLAAIPFPLGLVPGTESAATAIDLTYDWVTAPLGRWWLQRDVATAMNGSGDQTSQYLKLLVQLAVTPLIAGVWAYASLRRARTDRTIRRARTYIRYFLAATMLMYGWIKVFGMQMPAPGADRFVVTLGDTSPMGLLWTFMGASALYQAFAGVCEVLGGVLLLWRRTALLGALVSAGVMTNVVMLNLSYDVPVKIFSSTLLLMSLWLLAPHASRLAAVLVLNLPAPPLPETPSAPTGPWRRRLGIVVHALAIVLFVVMPAVTGAMARAEMDRRAATSELDGVYTVEHISGQGAFDFDDGDGTPWVRVGIALRSPGGGTWGVQRQSGATRRGGLRVDGKAHTLSFLRSAADTQTSVRMNYVLDSAGVVVLTGTVGTQPVTVRLRRMPPSPTLLMDRGFHWVNERPYNR